MRITSSPQFIAQTAVARYQLSLSLAATPLGTAGSNGPQQTNSAPQTQEADALAAQRAYAFASNGGIYPGASASGQTNEAQSGTPDAPSASASPISDAGGRDAMDRQAALDLANSARAQLQASMLSIANANNSVVAQLLR